MDARAPTIGPLRKISTVSVALIRIRSCGRGQRGDLERRYLGDGEALSPTCSDLVLIRSRRWEMILLFCFTQRRFERWREREREIKSNGVSAKGTRETSLMLFFWIFLSPFYGKHWRSGVDDDDDDDAADGGVPRYRMSVRIKLLVPGVFLTFLVDADELFGTLLCCIYVSV